MRRTRGVTLIELVVASTLLLLVTALTFGYLIPAAKAANKARVKGHLQQTATVIASVIKQAATTTSPAGFSWSSSDTQGFGFNPVEELQPSNGILRWTDHYELFWHEAASQTLWNGEFTGTEPDEATIIRGKRLLPGRLREVFGVVTKKRALARGVTSFTVSHGGGDDALIQPVTVTFSLIQPGFSDSPVVERSLTFRMVNQQ